MRSRRPVTTPRQSRGKALAALVLERASKGASMTPADRLSIARTRLIEAICYMPGMVRSRIRDLCDLAPAHGVIVLICAADDAGTTAADSGGGSSKKPLATESTIRAALAANADCIPAGVRIDVRAYAPGSVAGA